jgi:hypothetical protein
MLVCALNAATSAAQDGAPPSLRVGSLSKGVRIDGDWTKPSGAPLTRSMRFTQSDPSEGAAPTGRTVVRVLASAKAIVAGILCEDPDPSGIVRRDAPLASEDHVRVSTRGAL